ncbi:MAG TPA: DUF3298 domain-containing protein [bacterium]|nr:DUF3298 domain-containing protein [bacterium]
MNRTLTGAMVMALLVLAALDLGAETAAVKGAGVAFEEVKLAKKTGSCKKDAVGDCATISVKYPRITQAPSDEAREAMNAAILKVVLQPAQGEGPAPKRVEQIMDRFLAEYINSRDPEFDTAWEEELEVGVQYNGPRVVCLGFSHYAYTGGAHPSSNLNYLNLETATGKTLALSDIMKPGYEKQLTAIAEKQFRKDKGLAPGASLADAGYNFDGDKFKLNDNFAVLKDGLHFYYNFYEIASYAEGPIEIVIKWSEIKGLLKKGGPVKLPLK